MRLQVELGITEGDAQVKARLASPHDPPHHAAGAAEMKYCNRRRETRLSQGIWRIEIMLATGYLIPWYENWTRKVGLRLSNGLEVRMMEL